MVNHKEILRLKNLGLTNREIADAAGCGRNTVTRTLARAREQQLGWQQAQSMSQQEVFQWLFPTEQKNPVYKMPDYEWVHREMQKSGVTLSLLWVEYCEQCRQNGELPSMKLKEAAKKVEDSIEETLTYCDFPSEHWTRIRTNNVIERLNREIRRRTRVVGSFPDGNSALMLVCARLRHVAGTQWGNKKYMNMKHLETAAEDASIAG